MYFTLSASNLPNLMEFVGDQEELAPFIMEAGNALGDLMGTGGVSGLPMPQGELQDKSHCV